MCGGQLLLDLLWLSLSQPAAGGEGTSSLWIIIQEDFVLIRHFFSKSLLSNSSCQHRTKTWHRVGNCCLIITRCVKDSIRRNWASVRKNVLKNVILYQVSWISLRIVSPLTLISNQPSVSICPWVKGSQKMPLPATNNIIVLLYCYFILVSLLKLFLKKCYLNK